MSDLKKYQALHRMRHLLEAEQAGSLDEEQKQVLADILREDSDARAAYVAYQMVGALLELEHARPLGELEDAELDALARIAGETEPVDSALPQIAAEPLRVDSSRRQYWQRHPAYFGAVVAALTLALFVAFFAIWSGPFAPEGGRGRVATVPEAPVSPGVVADISGVLEPVWHKCSDVQTWRRSLLGGETVALESGLVQLTFTGGAVVLLEGPCRFVGDSSRAGTLEEGKLSAQVDERAIGFVVNTPLQKFTDLGTKFGIVVAQDSSTQLHVFEGAVSAEPSSGQAGVTRLVEAGHSLVISREGIVGLTARADATAFAQLPPGPAGRVVRSLSHADPRPAVLTAYYDFEGDFEDAPGAGEFADHLTPTGGALVDDPSPANGSTQSYAFNNATTHQVARTGAYTPDLTSGNSYTIMFWVKADDRLMNVTNSRLLTVRYRPDGRAVPRPAWQVEGHGLKDGNSMDLRIQRVRGGGGEGQWFAPDAVGAMDADGDAASDRWHHVAFVVANSGSPRHGCAYLETFVDGVSVGLREYAEYTGRPVRNVEGMLIVGGVNERVRSSSGLLDDVALWDGVVPGADIADIAAGRKSPADFLAQPTADVQGGRARSRPDKSIQGGR